MWLLVDELLGWGGGGDVEQGKEGWKRILPFGLLTAPEASREGLQADAGADSRRVFVRFWGLSKIVTQSWQKCVFSSLE